MAYWVFHIFWMITESPGLNEENAEELDLLIHMFFEGDDMPRYHFVEEYSVN